MQQKAHRRDVALQAREPGVDWHEMRSYLQGRLEAAAPKNKALLLALGFGQIPEHFADDDFKLLKVTARHF